MTAFFTKRILTYITICILFFSCSKTNSDIDIVVESFPVEESLQGTRIDLADGEYLSNNAFFVGDYLVFYAIREMNL